MFRLMETFIYLQVAICCRFLCKKKRGENKQAGKDLKFIVSFSCAAFVAVAVAVAAGWQNIVMNKSFHLFYAFPQREKEKLFESKKKVRQKAQQQLSEVGEFVAP